MIELRYNLTASCYTALVSDLRIGDMEYFSIKFDTGASCTVIGIYTLFNLISPNKLKQLKEGFEDSGIKPRDFSSATGHKMLCYPCRMHNVKISGHVLQDFYFYLVLDTKRKMSLLGNDFISCCKFRHDIDSDIIIEDYDLSLYNEKFSGIKCFDIDEVSTSFEDILNDMADFTESADIAAAFNNMLSNKSKC